MTDFSPVNCPVDRVEQFFLSGLILPSQDHMGIRCIEVIGTGSEANVLLRKVSGNLDQQYGLCPLPPPLALRVQ